jgi:hypothetical protein
MRLLCFILFLSSSVFANLRLEKHIHHLQKTTHSDIADVEIKLYTIDDPDYFFVSNFGWRRILLGCDQYRIGYNPLIFEQGIGDAALEGILAHELVHTEDYHRGSTLGTLLPIGVRVSFQKSRIQYERKTDIKTIQKGFADQLIAFKKFQYPLLSEEDLAIKKQEYLTPEEIKLVQAASAEEIQDWLDHEVPLNTIQFRAYDWFRTHYPHFKSSRKSRRRKIKLDDPAGKWLIPVNRRGEVLFSKTKPAKKSIWISSPYAGYILYDQTSVEFLGVDKD